MLIGVDFDNTLACYDGVFERVAREWGLPIAPGLVTREEIRNHLNEHGHTEDFTRLQGYVYGPGLSLAQTWPGAKEFVAAATSQGHRVVVVSHKTRHPLIGEPYDLRQCALKFLRDHRVLPDEPVVGRNVYFEETIEEKVHRAMTLQVDAFIDDLPEVIQLFDPEEALIRILFDPRGIASRVEGVMRASSWCAVTELLLSSSQCR